MSNGQPTFDSFPDIFSTVNDSKQRDSEIRSSRRRDKDRRERDTKSRDIEKEKSRRDDRYRDRHPSRNKDKSRREDSSYYDDRYPSKSRKRYAESADIDEPSSSNRNVDFRPPKLTSDDKRFFYTSSFGDKSNLTLEGPELAAIPRYSRSGSRCLLVHLYKPDILQEEEYSDYLETFL